MNVFAVIPTFIPLDAPSIPDPVVYREDQYERWWYPYTRSEWVVVEDCWSNSEISELWNSLELPVRQMLVNTPKMGLASSDLDWRRNGFCLRIQGLERDVMAQRHQYFDILKVGTIGSGTRIDDTLDQVHYALMADDRSVRRAFQRRRLWNLFWEDADQRTVYTSSEPLSLFPLYNNNDNDRSALLSSKSRRRTRMPSAVCNRQVRPEFPQIAVTIEAAYGDLSTSEMRVLSAILGNGVRSRLSQRLREELGLVYSIGTRFTGDLIEIHYTVSPVNLVESLISVGEVLDDVSRTGPTATEVTTSRSMFLLRQYEILEDPASFVRMTGQFPSPSGWDGYIHRTLDVFDSGDLTDKPIESPSLRVWMTGPLNHSELVNSESFNLKGPCLLVEVDKS